jgi:phosphinothricin acetyltransferase
VKTADAVIRPARRDDAAAIAAIHNDAVRSTTAIWTDVTVDADDRAQWMQEHEGRGEAVLVAVDADDAVLGYATFGPWRAKDGYRHTVEHSVYVRSDSRGGGLGRALLVAIVDEARRSGKHVMVAAISSDNTSSIRLHEQVGFTTVGCLRQVGTKFGRWLDLTYLQLILDPRARPEAASATPEASSLAS